MLLFIFGFISGGFIAILLMALLIARKEDKDAESVTKEGDGE